MIFSGLSAFPLTPIRGQQIDEQAYIGLIKRLVSAKIHSIGALGSTGNYAYLTTSERMRVARLTIAHADNIPVMIGIGALRTDSVLTLAQDAQKIGAAALLLAPVSYQNLTEDEVFKLYQMVNQAIDIPLCVYDNPATTHFQFTDELYGRIAQLSQVKSIKIPGVPNSLALAQKRLAHLRAILPQGVTIGVSGDAFGAMGLIAGCDLWYSAIAGILPDTARAITSLVQQGLSEQALALSTKLMPLWQLFDKYKGSLRVIAAIAEIKGVVNEPCLPAPLQPIQEQDRRDLAAFIEQFT